MENSKPGERFSEKELIDLYKPNPVKGVKHSEGKARYDLIPVSAMRGLAEILTYGATKYDSKNWERGVEWSKYYSALMRHLEKWRGGEWLDQDTGKSHLHHAHCNLVFMIELETTHRELDDLTKIDWGLQ
mgnify:CR=1 FL=1|jgi:hypothetical protein|tara:strand:- start:526 stop:915 length:390 start_codon:yes stop_codon:yes gene_type:complete